MLIMCILSILLTITGISIARKFKDSIGLEMIGQMIVILGAITIVILPIVWISSYSTDKANIEIYHTTKNSIQEARSQEISEVERATLTTKIIETNEFLASKKYWNGTIFGDMIPDELANLDYLK